jgi:hypothetical protein
MKGRIAQGLREIERHRRRSAGIRWRKHNRIRGRARSRRIRIRPHVQSASSVSLRGTRHTRNNRVDRDSINRGS